MPSFLHQDGFDGNAKIQRLLGTPKVVFSGLSGRVDLIEPSVANNDQTRRQFMNTPHQPGREWQQLLFLICLLVLLPVVLKGDLLEMTNGDRYAGKVISVSQTNLTFQSEVQGAVNVPRGKVARISFGESAVQPPATAGAATPNLKTNAPVSATPKLDFDSKSLKQTHEDLLATAGPEARRQFNDTVKGLMTGRISVDDIRAQARNAVKQIKSAKEESGEEVGDVLDGYLRILEHFLAETDKPATTPPVAKPTATNSVVAPTPQK